MNSATIDALANRVPGLALVNAYGATETTSPATMMPIGHTRDHADSVGVALPAAELKAMDDEGRELPPGQTGELWIAGPMVVPGYWDNPQANAASFTAGWWHSGDLGSIDAQGYVRVFDRKKDMLNRGGYKVYSVEVENALMAWPGMVEVAVVGRPCPVLGERVHAFVHAPGVAPDDTALRAHCAALLADYKVPESFTWSDAPLPRNANGKVKVHGVEIDHKKAHIGRARGIPIDKSIDELIHLGIKADLVAMHDVIEHLTDLGELSKLKDILNEDGLLYIWTPGFFRANLSNYWQNAHTYQFIGATLEYIMTNLGWEPMFIDEGIASLWAWNGGKLADTSKPSKWMKYIIEHFENREMRAIPPPRCINKFTVEERWRNIDENLSFGFPDIRELDKNRIAMRTDILHDKRPLPIFSWHSPSFLHITVATPLRRGCGCSSGTICYCKGTFSMLQLPRVNVCCLIQDPKKRFAPLKAHDVCKRG